MENKYTIYAVGALVGIGALLVVVLVPSSIADLDYYEMGFVKNKLTGSVSTDKVYFGGRYFVGVGKTFKSFRSDIHNVQFNRITIYNREKIEVTLTCSMQYILRPEDLVLLHDTYDLAYKPVIRSTALAAIKGAANSFSIDEYRMNRTLVARGLGAATAKALGGLCCRKDCVANKCRQGCMPYSKCAKADKGLFADVKHFQLQLVDITKQQEERFLRQVIEQERNDTENFKQTETITRKETDQLRIEIENEALEVSEKALANSALIKSKADVQSEAMIENARNQGLQIIYTALNITDEEHKKTIDYVRTLRDSKSATLYVGFQYMVARP